MLEHRSVIGQLVQEQNGAWALRNFPQVTVEAVEENGPPRNWLNELGLPANHEDLEILARPRGLSARRLSFILVDESPTRFPGQPRLNPEKIGLPPAVQLELGHIGYAIGTVDYFAPLLQSRKLSSSDDPVLLQGIAPSATPFSPEGDFIFAIAKLFDSPLAEAAWRGVEEGIFTHACPIIYRRPDEPAGGGVLIEVSVVGQEFPGCPNARILRRWEEVSGG